MFNKRRALIPAILSASLLASPVPALAGVAVSGTTTITGTVPAAVSSGGSVTSGASGSGSPSQPAISLDKAVSAAKQAFTIPGQDTDFSSNLSRFFMERQIWDLHWMDPQNQPSGVDIQVDAATGEVISMRIEQFFDSQALGLQIPTITEEDAQKIATGLMTRLDSAKIPELQLQTSSNSVLANNYGIPLYSFYWQRTINNIPFAGDGVTVQVNGTNGQVMLYNQNWTAVNGELPDPQTALSLEKAQEAFQDNAMLQLQYFQPSAYLPYGGGPAKLPVKLVYALSDKYANGAIDALSGEPLLLTAGSFNSSRGMFGWSPIYSGRGAGPLSGLSSQEQGTDENTHLISQDEALKTATQWVDLPAGVVFQNASLSTYGMSPEQKVWNLSWASDPEKRSPGQGMLFVNATVDAVTGELLNFNSPLPPGENGQASQLTRDQALQIAQEFLQKIQPQYSAQVELREDNPLANVPGQNGMESFSFYRTANGVPFMNNGFNITVDATNKHILNYSCNWSDIELPAPDGVIKPDQANAAYLKGNPLSLSYVQMYSGNKPGAVKLVYFPQPDASLPLGANLLDAQSGALLGWDGRDVANLPRSSQFQDISGNFAEKEIALLGQAGILTEYKDQFKPDQAIGTGALLRAMLSAQTGTWSTYLQSDQDILKAAQKLGWVGQDAQPADSVNREMLAQLMIHFLKLDNIAQLKDAFQEPYSDAASFPSGTEGYIAFGRALGLFHFEGDQFKPEQPVTRAEAAYALVQALKFERQGSNGGQ